MLAVSKGFDCGDQQKRLTGRLKTYPTKVQRNCCDAATASSSQRSFSGCPECPRTTVKRTLCFASSASSLRQCSSFLRGLNCLPSLRRQLLRFHPGSHSREPLATYSLSVMISTSVRRLSAS